VSIDPSDRGPTGLKPGAVGALVLIGMFAQPAKSDTFIWTGDGSAFAWLDPANWTNTTPGGTAVTPNENDDVVFSTDAVIDSGAALDLLVGSGATLTVGGAPVGGLGLLGDITNNGVISLLDDGVSQDAGVDQILRIFDATMEIEGTGELRLGGADTGISGRAGALSALEQEAGHTIRGAGRLSRLTFINRGSVIAEHGVLELDNTSLVSTAGGALSIGVGGGLSLSDSSIYESSGSGLVFGSGAQLGMTGSTLNLQSGSLTMGTAASLMMHDSSIDLDEGVFQAGPGSTLTGSLTGFSRPRLQASSIVLGEGSVVEGGWVLDTSEIVGDLVVRGTTPNDQVSFGLIGRNVRIFGGVTIDQSLLSIGQGDTAFAIDDAITLTSENSAISGSHSTSTLRVLTETDAIRGHGSIENVEIQTPGDITVEGGDLFLDDAVLDGLGQSVITIGSGSTLNGEVTFSGGIRSTVRDSRIVGQTNSSLGGLALEGVDFEGELNINEIVALGGAITNDAILRLTPETGRGFGIDNRRIILTSPSTLEGAGELVFGGEDAELRSETTMLLNGAGHTIRGAGSIVGSVGPNQFVIDNRGAIIAENGALELRNTTIDLSAGGSLRVDGTGQLRGYRSSGSFQGGTIRGGTLEIDEGGSLGGDLSLIDTTINGGVGVTGELTLTRSLIQGEIEIGTPEDYGRLVLTTDYHHDHDIRLINGDLRAGLVPSGARGGGYIELSGDGEVILENPNRGITSENGALIRNGVGHVVRGHGEARLANRGTIIAEGGVLHFDGLFGEGGGLLHIASDGVVTGLIRNTRIESDAGGLIGAAILEDVTLADGIAIDNSGGAGEGTGVSGLLTTEGVVTVRGELRIDNDTTLAGAGEIAFLGPDGTIEVNGAGVLEVSNQHRITGVSVIDARVENSGEIVSGNERLFIETNSNRFTNTESGRVVVRGGALLESGRFSGPLQGGEAHGEAGARVASLRFGDVRLTGSLDVEGDSVGLRGSTVEGELNVRGGALLRIDEDLVNHGLIRAGDGSLGSGTVVINLIDDIALVGTGALLADGPSGVIEGDFSEFSQIVTNGEGHTLGGNGILKDLRIDNRGRLLVNGDLTFDSVIMTQAETGTVEITSEGVWRPGVPQALTAGTIHGEAGSLLQGDFFALGVRATGELAIGGDVASQWLASSGFVNDGTLVLTDDAADLRTGLDQRVTIGAPNTALTGVGEIILTGEETGITGAIGASVVQSASHTLRGSGRVEGLRFVNEGTVTAQDGELVFTGETINHGAMSAGAGSVLAWRGDEASIQNGATGVLSGDGVVDAATFDNQGTLAPGEGVGELTITGDVSNASSSILEIEVGGLGDGMHDRLVVGGEFEAAGGLEVRFLDSFALDDLIESITIIDAAGLMGDGMPGFDSITITGGYRFDVEYSAELGLVKLANIREIPSPPSAVIFTLGAARAMRRRRQPSSCRGQPRR